MEPAPRPRKILTSLRLLAEILADPTREAEFEPAATQFRSVFRRTMEDRGLERLDELTQLVALELALAADPDLDGDLFAAAKTVRDWITSGRHEQASLN